MERGESWKEEYEEVFTTTWLKISNKNLRIKNLDCVWFSTCFLLIDFNRVTSRASLFHLTINSTTIIRRLYYLIMLNGYQI